MVFICVYRVYRSLIPSVNRLLWTCASGWRKYLSGLTRCATTSYKSSPNSKKNEAHLKQMKLQEPPCQPGDRTIPWGNLHNTLAWRTQAAGSLRLWSKHPICWHLLISFDADQWTSAPSDLAPAISAASSTINGALRGTSGFDWSCRWGTKNTCAAQPQHIWRVAGKLIGIGGSCSHRPHDVLVK